MYVPGYQFHVSGKYESGKCVAHPRIYVDRYTSRSDDDVGIEIEDNERLQVIRYDTGAVYVRVLRTGQEGYLS